MTGRTIKRMVIMLVIAAILIGAMTWFTHFKNTMIAKAIKGQANPPETVATVVAQETSWQPVIEALGSLRASEQAALSAEVGGLVTAVHFDSGAKARAGQHLVELNAAPLEGQLAQLEAQAGLARVTLARDQAQLEARAIARAVVDTDVATLKSAEAQIAAQKALIAQKSIVAPFAGRLGIRQVDVGQFLAAGAAVVTLQKLDPMEVDFTVPQNQIALVTIGMQARLETSAVPGKTFEATVTAIEPQVDPSTRNMKVRARVPNPNDVLLPGVFVIVHIGNGAPRQYVTLPNAAITYNPYGATVFVARDAGKGPDGKPRLTAEQRFVTPGLTRGDQVAIVSGLKAGETVVTAGQLKLRNGSPLVVNNSLQPSDNPNPVVHDN
ncbi:MAG TPA: efflux RND transporter periplasmic adaptor subunit [Casimicrobiaceae bacterium]